MTKVSNAVFDPKRIQVYEDRLITFDPVVIRSFLPLARDHVTAFVVAFRVVLVFKGVQMICMVCIHESYNDLRE